MKFPKIFDVNSLNGTNGFVINDFPINANNNLVVSKGGDVNNDGIADLLIGANEAFNYTGISYVLFGSKQPFSAVFKVGSLNGTNGFIVDGFYHGSQGGISVSGVNDINGDEISDIIIGAPFYIEGGRSYVIFGRKYFDLVFNISALDGTNGFTISNMDIFSPYAALGISVSGAGDLNNDGLGDAIIGIPNEPGGESFVVFGNRTFPAEMVVGYFASNYGALIKGSTAFCLFGASVDDLGDVNGDGISDVVIGNPGCYNGSSYVIFGQTKFPSIYNAQNSSKTQMFIQNDGDDHLLGVINKGVGDINGDGLKDIAIAAPFNNDKSYIIFGSKELPQVFNISSINGHNGFVITTPQEITIINRAGDLNNDKIDDVVLCSSNECYIIFGKNNFSKEFNVSTLDGSNGFIINGFESNNTSADAAGDINHDGIGDLIIGADQVYVLFGQE